MKSALTTVLLILGLIVVLAVAAYVYEQKWGLEGPFPNQHHHDHGPACAEHGCTNSVETSQHQHEHDRH